LQAQKQSFPALGRLLEALVGGQQLHFAMGIAADQD